jgi:hypothetical protein
MLRKDGPGRFALPAAVAVALLGTAWLAESAAQAPERRGGPGSLYPAYEPDDDTNFAPIFEDGSIVGETTPEKVVKVNSFLIWRGGVVKDFELKVEFRLSGANSGIQYRSVELPDVGKWVLKGYQADMDFRNGFSANLHEERGRKPGHVVLARRGLLTRLTDGPKYKELASLGDATLLRGVINVGGWNQYHIIARGPVMLQILNGRLVSGTIDEDTANFVPEGLIGFQMHTGPPFKIEYRNVLYRKL